MNKLKSMTPEKRSLVIGLVIYGLGIIVFFPFIFFDNLYYLLTGWLLGMVINLVNYGLIIYQGHMLQRIAAGASSASFFIPVMYFLRFGLYVAGLVLVGVLHNNGLDYFNIFTTFGAYLVISAVIFLSGLYFPKPGAVKK